MKIYLDVLIFLNAVVDFLIIAITEKIGKTKSKVYRKILAAFVASLFSLAMFLPTKSITFQLFLRLICSSLTVLIAFGFKKIKVFLRNLIFFYISSFLYVGLMLAVWFVFKPQSLAINNSVVYFNISPLLIITITFLSYLIISVARILTEKNSKNANRCQITIYLDDKSITKTAIVDTGHTLKDSFTDSQIIFVDQKLFFELIGSKNAEQILSGNPINSKELNLRFRLIPCGSVTGQELIKGLRCDKAKIELKEQEIILNSPILALSKTKFLDDYDVIISADAIKENIYAI